MDLFPVQKVVVKLIENIPLDHTDIFDVWKCSVDFQGDLHWEKQGHTEQSYVDMLQQEGRYVLPVGWHKRSQKQVFLAAGKKSGKSLILSKLMELNLARLVVHTTAREEQNILTVSTEDQAQVQQEQLFFSLENPNLAARRREENVAVSRFQTDADIQRTDIGGDASIRVISARTFKVIDRLKFFCLDAKDMSGNEAFDLWHWHLNQLEGTALFLARRFNSSLKEDGLFLQIPTWEMNPIFKPSFFDSIYAEAPSFWETWGASKVEMVSHKDLILHLVWLLGELCQAPRLQQSQVQQLSEIKNVVSDMWRNTRH
jgi:hypothetical protein